VSLPRFELDTSRTEVKSITASADFLGKAFDSGMTIGLCPVHHPRFLSRHIKKLTIWKWGLFPSSNGKDMKRFLLHIRALGRVPGYESGSTKWPKRGTSS
jgi:hypothetical protein